MGDDPFKDKIGEQLQKLDDAVDGGARRAPRQLEESDMVARNAKLIERALSPTLPRTALDAFPENTVFVRTAEAQRVSTIFETNQQAITAYARLAEDMSVAASLSKGITATTSLEHLVGDYGATTGLKDVATSLTFNSELTKSLGAMSALTKDFTVSGGLTKSLIDSLSGTLAHTVDPFGGITSSDTIRVWQDRLATQMSALREPWVLPRDPARSVLGYAHLSRMSEALHSAPPYSREVNRLFKEELGGVAKTNEEATPEERDQAALNAGMRPELIAFAPPAFTLVVESVGLVITLPPLSVPLPIEGSNPGATYDPAHKAILTQLETRLRLLVEEELRRLSGTRWIIDRVSGELRAKWDTKQQEARSKKWPVYSLIHYADLDDLRAVICQRNNWRDAFESIFRHKEQFTISMLHLTPIRNANAHERPIGKAQALVLITEAWRILSAMGVDILDGKQ